MCCDDAHGDDDADNDGDDDYDGDGEAWLLALDRWFVLGLVDALFWSKLVKWCQLVTWSPPAK